MGLLRTKLPRKTASENTPKWVIFRFLNFRRKFYKQIISKFSPLLYFFGRTFPAIRYNLFYLPRFSTKKKKDFHIRGATISPVEEKFFNRNASCQTIIANLLRAKNRRENLLQETKPKSERI